MSNDQTCETIMENIEALLEMADRAEEQGDIAGSHSYRQEAEWWNAKLDDIMRNDSN